MNREALISFGSSSSSGSRKKKKKTVEETKEDASQFQRLFILVKKKKKGLPSPIQAIRCGMEDAYARSVTEVIHMFQALTLLSLARNFGRSKLLSNFFGGVYGQVLDFFGVDPTKGLTDTQVSLKVCVFIGFLFRLWSFVILYNFEV